MIKIDPQFQALIPPLDLKEREQLILNLKNWGCLDPLKVWANHDILLDGHNRFDICHELNIPFEYDEIVLSDRDEAISWIIENQLGRRNLSPANASYLRGVLYEQIKNRHGGDRKSSPQNEDLIPKAKTAEVLAQKHGVSRATIERDGKFAQSVDALEAIAPGTKAEILSSNSELTKAEVLKLAEGAKTQPEKTKEALASKQKRIRVANDYYPTPVSLIEPLLNCVDIKGIVLEPCAGHGAIASQFPGCITNEPYPTGDYQTDFALDATQSDSWLEFGAVDWVVTNPPYGDMAISIVQNALDRANVGVAMLLRLSWLEPCCSRKEGNRDKLLIKYADCMTHMLIASPRPNFRADTDSSDSITVAWVIWQKNWSWRKKKIFPPFQFVADWKS